MNYDAFGILLKLSHQRQHVYMCNAGNKHMCNAGSRGGGIADVFHLHTAGRSMEDSAGDVQVPRLPHEEVPACSPQRGSGVGHLCVHQKEGGETRG